MSALAVLGLVRAVMVQQAYQAKSNVACSGLFRPCKRIAHICTANEQWLEQQHSKCQNQARYVKDTMSFAFFPIHLKLFSRCFVKAPDDTN